MKVSILSIISTCLFLVGCGGDEAAHGHGPDDGHGHGDSGESQAANPQRPSRPASKLANVKTDDAWKTPLNLARFTVQQKTIKRWFNEALHDLVIALVKSGELEQAAEVALLFPSGSGNSAMSYLVEMAAESGDIALALKVAQWIEPPHGRAIAHCQVATAQAKAGDKSEALATIQQAERLARGLPNEKKPGVLVALALAKVAAGDKRQAVAVGEQAVESIRAEKNDIWYGNYYNRIARMMVRAGEIQKAKAITQSGKGMWDKAVGGRQRKEIAVIMAEEGELEEALEWISQFPVSDTPEQQKKDGAYTDIAMMLAKQGNPKRAMEVMNRVKIRIVGWPQDLVKLAAAMAESGELDEAMKLFQQNRSAADNDTLRILATAHFAAGQKEQALQLLKQATQKAEEGGLFQGPKHVALETVALAYLEAGEHALAATVLKKAVAAARVFKKNKYVHSTKESAVSKRLLDLISTAIKVGDKELTTAIIDEALGLAREGKVYTSTAEKLVVLQDYRRAMEIARLHENDKSLKSAMTQMAKELTRKEVPRSWDARIGVSALKKSFTSEEQAFAKQLVESMRGE